MERSTPDRETEASSGDSGKEGTEAAPAGKRVKEEEEVEGENEEEDDDEDGSEDRDESGRFTGCRPLRSACMDYEVSMQPGLLRETPGCLLCQSLSLAWPVRLCDCVTDGQAE